MKLLFVLFCFPSFVVLSLRKRARWTLDAIRSTRSDRCEH